MGISKQASVPIDAQNGVFCGTSLFSQIQSHSDNEECPKKSDTGADTPDLLIFLSDTYPLTHKYSNVSLQTVAFHYIVSIFIKSDGP